MSSSPIVVQGGYVQPQPGAVIDKSQHHFPLVGVQQDAIDSAKEVIKKLKADIDQLKGEQATIRSSHQHFSAALTKKQLMSTTALPHCLFGRSLGRCLECGAEVDCCPLCGQLANYAFRVGDWIGAGDISSPAHETFQKLEVGPTLGGYVHNLHQAACINCGIAWYWLTQEDIDW